MATESLTDYIRTVLTTLIQAGQVAELRALGTPQGTQSGYFNDLDAMAHGAGQMNVSASGVYVTLNSVNPALLGRANNHLRGYTPKGGGTGDQDILGLRWLLVDFDPVRPAGISSTEAEHQAALDRALKCQEWLKTQGCPPPLLADSGNDARTSSPWLGCTFKIPRRGAAITRELVAADVCDSPYASACFGD